MKTPQDRRMLPLFPKLLAALLLMGTAVSAQIETYVVDVVAKQPVVIDGRLNEECWQGPALIKEFQPFRLAPDATMPETRAWLAKEKDALLIAVECMEPDMKSLYLKATEHDGKTWMDDSVELFFNPAGDRQSHVQIVVNANGVIMDGISDYFGAKLDLSWESGLIAKVQKQKDRWVLEARLPYANLPLGRPGADWTFHIARGRRAGVQTQLATSLKSSISKFAELTAFDVLRGISPEGMRLSLVAYDFGDCQVGRNEARLTLKNWDQKPAEVVVRGGLSGQKVSERTVTVAPQKEADVAIEWELTEQDAGANLEIEVLSAGRVIRKLMRQLATVPPVLGKLERNVFYLTDCEATTVRFPVQVATLSRRQLTISWWLADQSGRCVVSGFTHAIGPEAVLRIFWSFADSGRYQLLRRLEQDGRIIAEARDDIVLIRGPF